MIINANDNNAIRTVDAIEFVLREVTTIACVSEHSSIITLELNKIVAHGRMLFPAVKTIWIFLIAISLSRTSICSVRSSTSKLPAQSEMRLCGIRIETIPLALAWTCSENLIDNN